MLFFVIVYAIIFVYKKALAHAYKPNSVPPRGGDDHLSRAYIAVRL
ncbi:MAG: hypothetical protein UW24_C0003G0028 [Parcubacteria group bacterium GW2011_GWA2_44_12]|nr:MAG: hypothetical protein UW24_C0003G0028 [Parcubacteria group bacterium GW2011_GWA2_44_12]